jgi:ABC-type sulfate transport system permease component
MMKKTLGVMVSMLAFAALAMPAERWIHILIKVHERRERAGKTAGARKAASTVDIKIPFKVAHALLSGSNDELNVLAAVRALCEYPNLELVTVKDESDNVRIWVDSSNNAD